MADDADERRAKLIEYLYGKYDNDALDTVREAVNDDMLGTLAQLDRNDEAWAKGVVGWVFGEVYGRQVLDHKTRSLTAIAMHLSLGNDRAVSTHMAAALKHGASPEEIREVCLHAALYAGFPKSHRGLEALERAVEAFEASKDD